MRLGIALDDAEAVRERLVEGILAADVLVATGGVSVGAHDVVKEVFEELGTLDLWRVAIQPGKPLAYGSAPRPDGGYCLLFGLPGNPVSSFVTFELFVRPVLRRLRGEARPWVDPSSVPCSTSRSRKSRDRRAFIRVRVDDEPGPSGAPSRPAVGVAGLPRPLGAGARQRPGGHPGGRPRPAGRSRSGGHQA